MILRRIAEAFRRQDWFTVFIETMIVVLGVFIGLQVNNWNAAREDRQREAIYLAALHEDFVAVIAELEGDIAHYDKIAASMTLLLEQSRMEAPGLSTVALNKAAAELLAMEGTPIVSDAYSNLTGSGDLAVIRSQKVKNAMASFFGRAHIVDLVSATHEMQLVSIFQPYIINNLDYSGMLRADRGITPSPAFDRDRILTALPTSEFRNVIATKWDAASDLRNVLNSALVEARAVETLLALEAEALQ